MCGIVGWLTNERSYDATERRKFIEQALIIDTLRGFDSTGVFVVEHDSSKADPNPMWAKETSPGFDFVQNKHFQEIFATGKTQNYKYAVGHNRAATRGGVSLATAHPFIEGPITMVHNGTLDSTLGLGKSQYETKAANDSHTICHNLALYSPEEVIPKLDGAFALVWYDDRDDSLNFCRNGLRPFHMARSMSNRDTIYFASEAEMLHLLDKRIGLKLLTIMSLKPGFWLKFKKPDLMKPEVKELPLGKGYRAAHNQTYEAWEQAGWGSVANPSVSQPTSLGTTSKTGLTSTDGTKIVRMKEINKAILDAMKDRKVRKNPESSKLIPSKLEEDLMDLDLDPETPVNFTPIDIDMIHWENKTISSTVWGVIHHNGRKVPCCVHGVHPITFKNQEHRVWSVYPQGMLMANWTTPLVVARFRSALSVQNNIMPAHQDYELPQALTAEEYHSFEKIFPSNTSGNDNDDEIAEAEVCLAGEDKKPHRFDVEPDEDALIQAAIAGEIEIPGPGNQFLSETEWYVRTRKGCVNCDRALSIRDAWGVEWVNDGVDPMCGECVAKYAEGGIH